MTQELLVWPPKESVCVKLSKNTVYSLPCKYIVSKNKLGDGSYSTVFECKNKLTGLHYAAKQYKKCLVYGLEEMLQNEFHILKKVSNSHPHILSLVDYFETRDYLYLVTDLARGGETFDRVISSQEGRLPEAQVREITRSLLSTVHYLHSNNIVHRDLKAENLLFQSKSTHKSSILVADFGLARITGANQKLHDRCGTLSYMAPEMLDTARGHSLSVDIWAIGVIVYFMLCGYMPFDCETDDETIEAISTGHYMFEPEEGYWEHVSADARDFITSCFTLDPSKRPTAQECLHHRFMSPNVRSSRSFDGFERPSLKRTSSSNASLTAKLKESVVSLHMKLPQNDTYSQQTLQRLLLPHRRDFPMMQALSSGSNSTTNISKIPSKLSLMEKSRRNSLIEGTTLLGQCCQSPETVSMFTTPIHSNAASRQQSLNDLLNIMDDHFSKSGHTNKLSLIERDTESSALFFI